MKRIRLLGIILTLLLTGILISTSNTQSFEIASNGKICIQPPAALVSWWPGDNDANDIQDGNDGTDDFVEVPNAPNLNFGYNSFSIDAWVYPEYGEDLYPIVFKATYP